MPPEADEMKEAELLLSSAAGAGAAADAAGLFGKGRYKFWALAAIILLAFWSMFTGTVTLKWSAGNLGHVAGDLDVPIHDDLDVLVRPIALPWPEFPLSLFGFSPRRNLTTMLRFLGLGRRWRRGGR